MSDNKLTPDQLSKISGGYTEDDILLKSYGTKIECPWCHATSRDDVIPDVSDDILDKGNYYCKICKKHFTVDPAI